MIVLQVERDHASSGQTLRSALKRAEAAYPGFTYELVTRLVKKADVSLNMNEALLRLQGSVNESECLYFIITLSLPTVFLIPLIN